MVYIGNNCPCCFSTGNSLYCCSSCIIEVSSVDAPFID